jgi:hypothetical protein
VWRNSWISSIIRDVDFEDRRISRIFAYIASQFIIAVDLHYDSILQYESFHVKGKIVEFKTTIPTSKIFQDEARSECDSF